MLFFFSFLWKKGNKKWKMHMHTSRWQSAMTVNYLRKELLEFFWKHFTYCWYFENQKATTLSNDNKALPYSIFAFTEDDITKYISCLFTHHICLKHHNSELTNIIILSLVWQKVTPKSTPLLCLKPSGKRIKLPGKEAVSLSMSKDLNNSNRSDNKDNWNL